MCALFGWLDYKHIVPYKVLKKLTQLLANAAEERGTDAAGISYVKDGRVSIYKRPRPSHKIHFNAPEGTTAVMGGTLVLPLRATRSIITTITRSQATQTRSSHLLITVYSTTMMH